jgi:hypothetical protein
MKKDMQMTELSDIGIELLLETVDGFKPIDKARLFRIPETELYVHELFEGVHVASDDYVEDLVEEFPWGIKEEPLISMEWHNSSDTLALLLAIMTMHYCGLGLLPVW